MDAYTLQAQRSEDAAVSLELVGCNGVLQSRQQQCSADVA